MKATILLLLTALALGATPAAGQYFEPFPRRPGVELPASVRQQSLRDLIPTPWGQTGPVADGPMARRITEGTLRILVVPALFSDSDEPDIPTDSVGRVLFDGASRSVKAYYQEVSNGRLTVAGEVTPWVRTSVPILEAAGNENGHGFVGPRAQDHIRTAVDSIDPLVDFREYDNDGPDGIPNSGDDDGYVDAIIFSNLEIPGSCGGPGFWPHFSWLRAPSSYQPYPTNDIGVSGAPIRISTYIADSVVDCGGSLYGPGVPAHELGHVIGLGDRYRVVDGLEPEYRHWVIGCFGLMGAGSWGCGDGTPPDEFGPTGLSVPSRLSLGWIEREMVVGPVNDREYVLEPVQTSERALVVAKSGSSGFESEFLWITYRPRIGFDDALPAGGVLIYQQSGLMPPPVPGGVPDYNFQLLEADGDSALRKVAAAGGDRGVAGDVFAGDGASDDLPGTGAPSTAYLGGQPSQLVIHSIRIVDGTARIRLSNASTLNGHVVSETARPTALADYEARFAVTNGTPPYTAHEPAGGLHVPGLSLEVEGDDIYMRGRPAVNGERIVPISVSDATGEVWRLYHRLTVEDAELADRELMAALVGEADDAALAEYLDGSGNRDGTVDVADLRAYLIRQR